MKITSKAFGKTKDGQDVTLFTLENDNQVTINISNYGGLITSIYAPDKDGNIANIVCGFDKLDDYLSEAYLGSYPYFGCIIGRFGNRIANGKYTVEGVEYTGAINNGPNHLHGGLIGFDRKVWDAEIVEIPGKIGVKISYLSADGEEGYPGNLKVSCTYTLDNENKLELAYEAETDKTTIVNLTNHSYFNLTAGKENVLNHSLELAAPKYTEAVEMIPTGNIVSVEGTVFDFIKTKKLGKDIAGLADGYDLNYVLDNDEGKLVYAGCLSEDASGRTVKVYTTQPGIQLYTGYWIPELTIDGVKKFGSYSGVALETQHYPDSPNHANFPTTELKPGEKLTENTIYQFGTL
ncbi:aldose epimerase family protein [Mangrovibacterium diazotrophicum]|uniref:Aldose 1-epimerase n=1 Tax=Mangrovibacterium diazotrophicum TaxID=1261403 RepID=A0A419VZC7_9BACT|nr:aldose epimerase family protein [Mangrovibacterium diazotrophicum]RKD88499.1 aldose 1-epimerase [Mangrovibacterium diazotrophicum]